MSQTLTQPAQATNAGKLKTFHWDQLDEATRHAYIDTKSPYRVGSFHAWPPTDDFEDYVYSAFLWPILKNIFEENFATIFGSRHTPFATFKCCMISASASWRDARPTIVASCTKPKYARKIISMWSANPKVYRLESGFDFYADPVASDGRLRARDDHLKAPEFGPTGASVSTLCGMRILVSTPTRAWKHATLGGLILLDNQCYGVTTAHAFFDDVRHRDRNDADSDGQSDSVTDPGSNSPTQSEDHSGALRMMPSSNTIYLDPASYVRSRQESGETDIVQSGPDVELQAPRHLLGGLDNHTTFQPLMNRDDDWALVKISNPLYQLHNCFEIEGRRIDCSHVATQPPRGRVTVAAGFSGTITTSSSGQMVGLLLPGAHKLVDAWAIDGPTGKFKASQSEMEH